MDQSLRRGDRDRQELIDVSPERRVFNDYAIRLTNVALAAVYLHLIVVVYRDLIVPIYSYFNFRWSGFSPEDQAMATLVLAFMVAVMPARCRSFGQYVKWVLVYTVFAPTLVVPIASGFVPAERALSFNIIVLGSFLAMHIAHGAVSTGTRIHFPRLTWDTYTAVLMIVWVLVMGMYVAVAGTSILRNPFEDVYDARAEFRASVYSSNVLLAYAIPLVAKVVDPLLMVIGMHQRRPVPFLMGVVGSMLIFAGNSQKSIFVTIVLVPAIYIAVRYRGRLTALLLSTAFAVLGVMSLFSPALMEYIFRRIIVTPGLLVGIYVNNYEMSGFAYLQHSILGPWFDGERLPPAREIGTNYWGNPGMAANANFLGDGFANFGPVGMIGFAALLGTVLAIVDRITSRTDIAIKASASIGVVFALVDTALLTSLLTHGLLVMALLLAVFPLTEANDDKSNSSAPIDSKSDRPAPRVGDI